MATNRKRQKPTRKKAEWKVAFIKTLAVTGNVGFELQARSFSGRIRPEGLSLQSISMNRGALRATVGDASAVVIAGTFSGDVVVGRK
jgi:hypothetical protein